MFLFCVLNSKYIWSIFSKLQNTLITTVAFGIIKVISLNTTSLICQYHKHIDTTMLLTSGSKEAMLVKNSTGCSRAFLSLIINSQPSLHRRYW